jgi:hypothetical protein
LVNTICIVYLDDILIYSENEEEYTQHIYCILKQLQQNNLYANLTKCAFDVYKVDFLGYIVDLQGVRIEPGQIEAIQSWPVPCSVKDIQVFIGFTGFYWQFIRNYSKIIVLLTDLLKGSTVSRL